VPLPAALRLGGLRKLYGDVVALDGLDLEVDGGECVALIGHNGSGKTTAVRLAAGQLQPTAGTVTVAGIEVTGKADVPEARARLAFVPDTPVLYGDLTVGEHLELVALAHGLGEEQAGERIAVLLEELGLAGRREFLPGQLSRGLRQKTQLACALLRPFQVLLLNEPVVGLDPRSQRALRKLLRRAAVGGAGVVLTTHQLGFADGLADRAVILEDGRVADAGRFERVLGGAQAARLGLS
jgi:ABC-2 type transport system ATP-binding protein